MTSPKLNDYKNIFRENFAQDFSDSFADGEISYVEQLQLIEDLKPLFGYASQDPQIVLAALIDHAQHSYGDFRASHFLSPLVPHEEINLMVQQISVEGYAEIDPLFNAIGDLPMQAAFSMTLDHVETQQKLSQWDMSLIVQAQAAVAFDNKLGTTGLILTAQQRLLDQVSHQSAIPVMKQLLKDPKSLDAPSFALAMQLLETAMQSGATLDALKSKNESAQTFVSRICNDPRARASYPTVVIKLFSAYWDQGLDPALLKLNPEALAFFVKTGKAYYHKHADNIGEQRIEVLQNLAGQRLAIEPVPSVSANRLSDEAIQLLYLMQTTGIFPSEPLPPELQKPPVTGLVSAELLVNVQTAIYSE